MPKSAAQAFTQLLKTVEGILRLAGYARSQRTFRLLVDPGVGMIEVQKSAKSTSDRVILTVNVGVWSARVARFMTGRVESGPLAVDDCHWRERIGFLLPDRDDRWWTIGGGDDAAIVTGAVGGAIESVAVPAVNAHLRDEALRDEWLTGKSPGLTDIQRLLYLTILLKEIGPHGALPTAVAELERKSEGKAIESVVMRHIEKLGRLSPP